MLGDRQREHERDLGVKVVELGLGAAAEVEEQVLVELLGQRRAVAGRDLSSCQRGPTGVIRTRRGSRSACSSGARARMIRTSSRDSDSPSASPSPHSTTVTASSSEVSRSRSSSSSSRRAGRRRRARAPARRQRRVHPGDHERRRGDVAAHAETGAEALGERRLAGAEPAAEHDQVAGAQLPGQRPAEPAHRVGVGGLEDVGAQRPAQLDVRRLAPDLAEALPLPEPHGLAAAPRGPRRSGPRSRPRRRPRLDQRPRDAVPLSRGDDAEAAQVHRAADRVEHQRAHGLAVEARRAARRAARAARRSTPRSR